VRPAARRWQQLGLVALACAGLGARCAGFHWSPEDLLLHGDATDPETGAFLELPAGTPAILAGPDGEIGTGDDVVLPAVRGDVDLVIRTGIQSIGGSFPTAAIAGGIGSLPIAVAEPFFEGTPIPFTVGASDGRASPPAGNPTDPPSLEDVWVLAVAFGDLDGDGVIGVTHLDGDPLDFELEEEELRPLGRILAAAHAGRSVGEVPIHAGGPAGAELIVALGAAAYAGPFDPQHYGGVVPDGPLVMTRLPFSPRTDPNQVIDGNLPGPANPNGLVGVQVEPAYVPDPARTGVRERFSVRVASPHPSLDFARGRSGAFSRFGLVRVPDPASYRSLPGRPLRPGLDAGGGRAVYEVLQQLVLADDGAASQTVLRVVPLDRLGNIANLGASQSVTVRAEGGVVITAPDGDGDPGTETLSIANARGLAVTLDDDGGGSFDDPDAALLVESSAGLLRLDVFLPDPDVDDSGLVDSDDVDLVESRRNEHLGDPLYDARLDLSGDGRIRDEDVALVEEQLGESIPVP
jgi:hypothetical protein